jgi:hypothetical protein
MAETKFNFRVDALEKLECPATGRKQILVSDTNVHGLSLRITPSGSKTYVYYRRLPKHNESPSRVCEITIGKFEDVKLEQARNKATEYNHIV